MQTPLEIIANYGVSSSSYIRAIQEFNDPERPINLSKSQYEQGIADIIGLQQSPMFSNEKEARIYFLYTIQETIRAFQTNVPDMEEVWVEVNRRAEQMIANQPWAIKDYQTESTGEPKLDAAGQPKKRKGAKKQQAEVLYRKINDGKNDRPTIINALMEEIGLSKPGATTYFHNLKKQYGFYGPEPEKRQRKVKPTPTPPDHPESIAAGKTKKKTKAAIAREVYQELKDQPKDDIITEIIKRADTTQAGANTYYCNCVKDDTG